MNDDEERYEFRKVCTRLNDVRANLVEANEIRQTDEPTCRTEEDEAFFRVERLVMQDVRRHDRVARWYNFPGV